ncbi:unnamed protein product [Vitrella brassicaformis CCMP3155]|uniref:ATP-grasp domain-containing protein n=1 Tax=Vitrella brassicaformis (strain CCMP3155) TaxID=1169540 RepID=A0A0G4H0L0_VITBC|nr:unnamed protein product [Vitrella brassicaformis CCMP3155]|eukprot:CEM36871.1 unnamed protein product [Vitrella brassicaformis CCMP3155]
MCKQLSPRAMAPTVQAPSASKGSQNSTAATPKRGVSKLFWPLSSTGMMVLGIALLPVVPVVAFGVIYLIAFPAIMFSFDVGTRNNVLTRFVMRVKTLLMVGWIASTFPIIAPCVVAYTLVKGGSLGSFTGPITEALWMWAFGTQRKRKHKRLALLTGGKMTKTLQVARCLHRQGCDVIVIANHNYWAAAIQFSGCVYGYYTTPMAETDPHGYVDKIISIIVQEKVDLYIPVSDVKTSVEDSMVRDRLPPFCRPWCFDPPLTRKLDDKVQFTDLCDEMGLQVPVAYRITSRSQLHELNKMDLKDDRYVLKHVEYDPMRRYDMFTLPCTPQELDNYLDTRDIHPSPSDPWQAQQWITGTEYCTWSVIQAGKVLLHTCHLSSPAQLNYKYDDVPEILDWTEKFAAALNTAGQFSLDVIVRESDGECFVIECNPRTHSACVAFHDQAAAVGEVFLHGASHWTKPENQAKLPMLPNKDHTHVYWLYQEVMKLWKVRSFQQLADRVAFLSSGRDAWFEVSDPLPFLAILYWQMPWRLLQGPLLTGNSWSKLEWCIGKVVEVGGD